MKKHFLSLAATKRLNGIKNFNLCIENDRNRMRAREREREGEREREHRVQNVMEEKREDPRDWLFAYQSV
jgi:hypothetical protein